MRFVRPPLRLMQAAFVGACLFAFFMAVQPKALPIEDGGDKYLHMATFYCLELLALVTARRKRVLPALGLFALGALIEVVQGMVGRDRSLGDLMADTAGIVAAIIPWAVAHRWPSLPPKASA